MFDLGFVCVCASYFLMVEDNRHMDISTNAQHIENSMRHIDWSYHVWCRTILCAVQQSSMSGAPQSTHNVPPWCSETVLAPNKVPHTPRPPLNVCCGLVGIGREIERQIEGEKMFSFWCHCSCQFNLFLSFFLYIKTWYEKYVVHYSLAQENWTEEKKKKKSLHTGFFSVLFLNGFFFILRLLLGWQ